MLRLLLCLLHQQEQPPGEQLMLIPPGSGLASNNRSLIALFPHHLSRDPPRCVAAHRGMRAAPEGSRNVLLAVT